MDHPMRPGGTGEDTTDATQDSGLSGRAAPDGPHMEWTDRSTDHQDNPFEVGHTTGKRAREELHNGFGLGRGDLQARHVTGYDYQMRPPGHQDGPSPKRRKSQTMEVRHGMKEDPSLHGLTMSIWQKILGFVPPVFLGRLLRVSQSFRAMLDLTQPVGLIGSALARPPSKSDAIWAASRRRFAAGLPKNLPGKRDLEMWRLIRGNDCQLCHKKKPLCTGVSPVNPWQAGPGNHNVRVIWAFGVRCCGPCLTSSCEQEFSLRCSNDFPSFLISALHFCFVTDTMDTVPATTLRDFENSTSPVHKCFFKPHLQQILEQFETAKEYGQASAREWLNGLESRKKQEALDVARWEQWETKGGLKKVNARPAAKSTPSTRQSSNSTVPSKSEHAEIGKSGSSLSVSVPARVASPQVLDAPPHALLPNLPVQVNGLPQRPSPQVQPNTRPERNIKDVNEAKAARRMEIERRAMALDPPISPNLLLHMSSFQAALQITTPLTDRAWELLYPRLLSQRSEAELREQERFEQNRNLLASLDDPSLQDGANREASDRQWEVIQAPIREILGKFADEIIETQWAGGRNLTKDSRPNFAADVLLYCRRKYYESANQSDASNRANFLPSKLVLENMKWLFDHKVREHTEGSHRELFLCNGCEGNSKFYGFEAVIQHYAAKHTSSLSLGSVIVHWRAEWPEEPPFHPNPISVRNPSFLLPKSMASGPQNLSALQAPLQNTPNSYGQSFPLEPLSGNSMFSASSLSDQASIYNAASSAVFTPPTSFQSMVYSSQPGYLVSPSQYAASPGPQPPPVVNTLAPAYQYIQTNAGPAIYHPGYYQNDGAAQGASANLDLYQRQMTDMAQIAREIWFGIAGVKEMPQSVRIYIVIQHVVTRFEKLYTNEPSLSMFIDGINHNPQMRPVRSLNGLACKACVASSQQQAFSSDSQSRQLGDRRLFTLPHLLNHFRASHLEQDQSGMDTTTTSAASRLDWKHDMIELPNERVIAGLGTAPGIDVRKFELIAAVFPRVFATVPTGGTTHVTDSSTNLENKWHTSPKEHAAQLSSNDAAGSYSELSSSRPYSSIGYISRSTPGTPEPAAEHEYDPSRPADFGKIIESHQVTRSTSRRPVAAFDEVDERLLSTNGSSSAGRDYYPSSHGRNGHSGAYGDQLLRHHDRQGRKATIEGTASTDSPKRGSDQPAYIGFARASGRGSESPAYEQGQLHTTTRAEFDEVDKFLDDVVPEYNQPRDQTWGRGSAHTAGTPRRQSMDRDQKSNIVILSKGGTPEFRTINTERPERDERVGGATLRDDEVYAPQSGGSQPFESRPQIIYIRESGSGYQQRPAQFSRDRPSQITFLGNDADRSTHPAPSSYGFHVQSSTSGRSWDNYQVQPTVHQQASPSRPLYLEDGRIVVTERSDLQRVHNEHDQRPVQYVRAVQPDGYDAPRYYVAQPMDPGTAQPQFVYESDGRRYVNEQGETGQTGGPYVRY